MTILKLPQHQNPTTDDRTATAPYNFIPLPERVITVVDDPTGLPDHDTYINQGYPHTGFFEVTLTTCSPLYIRCPLTRRQTELEEQNKDRRGEPINSDTGYRDRIKNTPEFFYTLNKKDPVIPGSSLRGMLRSLLEIVSYGKIQPVTEKRLFLRTVDISSIAFLYRL
jgi:hypothetical protein